MRKDADELREDALKRMEDGWGWLRRAVSTEGLSLERTLWMERIWHASTIKAMMVRVPSSSEGTSSNCSLTDRAGQLRVRSHELELAAQELKEIVLKDRWATLQNRLRELEQQHEQKRAELAVEKEVIFDSLRERAAVTSGGGDYQNTEYDNTAHPMQTHATAPYYSEDDEDRPPAMNPHAIHEGATTVGSQVDLDDCETCVPTENITVQKILS